MTEGMVGPKWPVEDRQRAGRELSQAETDVALASSPPGDTVQQAFPSAEDTTKPPTEMMSTAKAVKWIIATVITPLSISLFAANVYIAFWFVRMATAGTPHEGPPPFPVIRDGVLLTAGIGLWLTVALWWFGHRGQASFSGLFGTSSAHLPSDTAYGLLLGGFWVAVYGLLGWPPFSDMFVADTAKLLALPGAVSAGICEEFLFRGFVLRLIAQAGGGMRSQVLWSSLAFSAAHLFWGPVGMLFTFLLGLSFATVTIRRGNVWAAVVAHTLLNLCIEPALFEKAFAAAST